MGDPRAQHREKSGAATTRWVEKAGENREEWGQQSVETLLLAAQEELGELTQAALEYQSENGDYGDLFHELDDLGALLCQLHWALASHEFDQSPDE